jgi:hypothetical protein
MADDPRKKREPYTIQYFDDASNGWVFASRHFNDISANANFEVRCGAKAKVRMIHKGKIIREQ